jgi:transcriptional regulator with XRE-family HTH domain
MKKQTFDSAKFTAYLQKLLEREGLSKRQAAMRVGLHGSTLGKYLLGRRPAQDTCIRLAESLQVDANELLTMAGYKPLRLVDRSLIDPDEFPPDIKAFAQELKQYSSLRRREIYEALRLLLKTE